METHTHSTENTTQPIQAQNNTQSDDTASGNTVSIKGTVHFAFDCARINLFIKLYVHTSSC